MRELKGKLVTKRDFFHVQEVIKVTMRKLKCKEPYYIIERG